MTLREFVLKCRTCRYGGPTYCNEIQVNHGSSMYMAIKKELGDKECPYYDVRPEGLLKRVWRGLTGPRV